MSDSNIRRWAVVATPGATATAAQAADPMATHHITGFVAQCDTAGQAIVTKENTTEIFPQIPIGVQTVVITGLDIPASPGSAVSIAVGAGTACKVTMYGYSEIG
jgi:hypothetical protein